MLNSRSIRRGFATTALLLATYCLLNTVEVEAATFTWNGSGSNPHDWTDDSQWLPNTGHPNAEGDIAILSAAVGGSSKNINLNANQTIGSLTIGDTNSTYIPYNLSGASTLIFDNTGTTNAEIKKTVAGNNVTDVISVSNITLNDNLTISNSATSGSITISSAIGNNGTNKNLTITGTSGSNTGLVTLTNANTYGGTTTINAGARVQITHGSALGTGNVTVGGGNAVSRLEFSGGITIANNFTNLGGSNADVTTAPRIASVSGNNILSGSILSLTSGGDYYPIHSVGTAVGDFFTIAGDINNNRSETRNLRLGGAGNGEVTGKIVETGSGTWNLFKDGGGTWTLSGANTYKGKTTIREGVLSVSSLNSVSAPSDSSSLGRPTTVANGTIDLGDVGTYGTLSYTGTGESTDRVINLLGTGSVLDASGSGALLLTSDFTATGAFEKELVLAGISTVDNTVSGKIVDNSGSNVTHVTKADAGTWILAGANTYTGDTWIMEGLLGISNNSALGTDTGAGGNFAGGYTEIVGGALALKNNISTNEVLYLAAPRAVDSEPHIFNLADSNEIAGVISTDAVPDATNKFFTVQSQGGGFLTISGDIRQDQDGEAVLTFRGVSDGEVTGDIIQPATNYWDPNVTLDTNVWSVAKRGNGTWTFSGNNNYTGTTTVTNGVLVVNGTHTNGGTYTIEASGTLAGSGVIEADIIVDGMIAPGNSPDTLNITGDVTLNGTLIAEVKSDLSDLLNVTGSVFLDENSSILELPGTNMYDDITYVLISASVELSGTFKEVHNLPLDSHELVYSDKAVSLVPIPEPASALLLAIGSTAALMAVRKRTK